MQAFGIDSRPYNVDRWLQGIVANLVDSRDTIQVDRAELWTLLDTLPVAILIATDRNCSRIVGNIAARSMLQVPLGSNLSQSAPSDEVPGFRVFADGELVDPANLPMQRAAAHGFPVSQSECEIRFDNGSSIFIAGHSIPIKDVTGEVSGSLGAFIDITEQRRNFERSGMVAREMAHRVKNTVSLIQALAHGTIRSQLDPDNFSAFEQRLVSIARAQDLVGENARADVGLADLIEQSVEGVSQRGPARLELEGPELRIAASAAMPLGMVFHEIATNACKYGALTSDSGSIRISWTLDEYDDRNVVSLSWTEDGGPTVEAPAAPGFGSKLIKSTMRSLLDGKVRNDFAETGLTVRLEFSVPPVRYTDA